MGLFTVENAIKAATFAKGAANTYNAGKTAQTAPSNLMPVNTAARVIGPVPAGTPAKAASAKAPAAKAAPKPPVKKAAPKPAPKPKAAAPKPLVQVPAPPAPEKTTYTIFGSEYKKSTVRILGSLALVSAVAYGAYKSR